MGLFVVVVIDAVELLGDPAARAVAEGGGDVAFLPGRVDALVIEQGAGTGDGGDLRVDVDRGVGKAFLLALPQLEVGAMDAQQLLGSGTKLTDLAGDPVGVAAKRGVGGVEPVGSYPAPQTLTGVVGEDADAADRVGEGRWRRSATSSATVLRPASATKARRTSLAPSKIEKTRLSRSALATGESAMYA